MSKASEFIRTTVAAGDEARDAGLTTPEDIQRFDDILYGTDAEWQMLDVYRPKAAEGQVLPVIVSVHGGGWVYGDKERYQYYCMNLAERGFAVVNFTYRLAPEFTFPSSMEDTNLVFTWVLEHREEYGFDTEHVFAVGDSAGAHLLGLYSCACTNPDYASGFPFRFPEGFAPCAIGLNCGVYRVTLDEATDELTREVMKDFLPEKGTPEELAQICVLDHITPQFPPTFLMTATGDFLQEQAPPLQATLLRNQVPFTFRFYGSAAEEPLGHVFHCNIRLEASKCCNDEECAFFGKYLTQEKEEAADEA
ncbi:MAG: alpha/beta hydrolase [Lachnospiraceae bacterium]|nr:alpha/beta hydrolase [Lachnospiraceae bacterium]